MLNKALVLVWVVLAIFVAVPALAQDSSVEEVVVVEETHSAQASEILPVESTPPTEIEDLDEALGVVAALIGAAKTGNWILVVSGALSLLVYVVRRFLWAQIPAEWIPASVVLTTSAGGLAAALSSGVGPLDAVVATVGGLLVGLTSIGFWELIGKRVLPREDPPS